MSKSAMVRLTEERDKARAAADSHHQTARHLQDDLDDARTTISEYAIDLRAANEERERLRAALKEIANDGCGLDGYDGQPGECRRANPDNRNDWCWCCIAQDALEKTE